MNLISRERAQLNVLARTPVSFTAAETALLDAAVEAASEVVRQWCGRDFTAGRHDELYHGYGTRDLFLRHAPVLAVERVALNPTIVLEVTNTSTLNQRATVQVTDTGLALWRIASGVPAADTSVTWAAYPTLGGVAAAVLALGNGWSARVEAAYAGWPSCDLRPIQGALNCARGRWAGLVQHVDELSDYTIVEDEGRLVWGSDAWNGNLRDGAVADGWPCGAGGVRVVYTAGYPEVPAPVQEATAEYAAMLFWQAHRDPGAASIAVVGAGTSTYSMRNLMLPAACRSLLLPYRRCRI